MDAVSDFNAPQEPHGKDQIGAIYEYLRYCNRSFLWRQKTRWNSKLEEESKQPQYCFVVSVS